VITIAHKIGTILESDKILVMKNGAVLEFDRPEELLKNQNTEFYTIVKLV
jgi:ABC-type multidrug transport system fused ATPase/permease subunit